MERRVQEYHWGNGWGKENWSEYVVGEEKIQVFFISFFRDIKRFLDMTLMEPNVRIARRKSRLIGFIVRPALIKKVIFLKI